MITIKKRNGEVINAVLGFLITHCSRLRQMMEILKERGACDMPNTLQISLQEQLSECIREPRE